MGDIPFNLNEFRFAIEFAKEAVKMEKNDADRIIILDYMIRVIEEDLKTDLLSYIFYSKRNFDREFDYPFPLSCYDEHGNEVDMTDKELIEIDLADSVVWVLPWHRERLRIQIKNLFRSDFVYDERNHYAYYYPYINLCYVNNGRHSISAGTVYKKGKIKAQKYDITKLFPHIYTDGKSWYSSHNNKKISELPDFRVGIIYEIAKMKYEIENSL